MKLIVGLGNPGREYENTRHNVGFMVIDAILADYGLDCDRNKFGGLYVETLISNEKYIFLKPQRYINLSGEVIRKYLDFYKISVEDMLIFHDDLDLPLGSFKLKPKGSSAGHNGLKNIESQIKTNVYCRMKIGISNDKTIDTKDYVLGRFSKEEKKMVDRVIETSISIFHDYTKMDFNSLMNKYNCQK